ncbi:SRPBCC family protein [Shimia sp. R9_3]|uniref:SRPBCC family protein n=1 Tax=Shimia sp. R9_3 TaxID=2821113 RepID=UPI001ADB2658|nr:SRPBCC family protein [Shimia sp. R9_3]MBO9399952.1 SRPBCC family protein [Shimia sp. R9_3]
MNHKSLAAVAAIALPSLAFADGHEVAVEFVEGNQITIYSPTHATVHTQVEIEAPAAVVWDVLMDEDKSWSPSFIRFDGPMEEGASVDVTLRDVFGTNNGEDRTLTFEWSFEEGRRIGWSGPSASGGPFSDNHQFVLMPVDEDTTLFVQSDDVTSTDTTVTDLSSEGTVGFLQALVTQNYMPFNNALKAEAEKQYQAQ